jgi:hypothetical protein
MNGRRERGWGKKGFFSVPISGRKNGPRRLRNNELMSSTSWRTTPFLSLLRNVSRGKQINRRNSVVSAREEAPDSNLVLFNDHFTLASTLNHRPVPRGKSKWRTRAGPIMKPAISAPLKIMY